MDSARQRVTAEGPLAALNGVCPYYTMFPLDFPLDRLGPSSRGEWVIDPFCGRGSTNYAARLLGLHSVGIDSNPVAVAISQAKFVHVRPNAVAKSCRDILTKRERVEVPSGEFWERCYHPRTLTEICRVREALNDEDRSPVRKALRAVMLGALHGPLRKKGEPDYLSNQMPRTYAAKPSYAVKFWKREGYVAPSVDVTALVRRRAARFFSALPPATQGCVIRGDSRVVNLHPHLPKRAAWVITSPPYLGMRTYVQDQWLRNWFVGGPPQPQYSVTGQLSHDSPGEFAHQLSLVWRNLASVCKDDARMVIRFGGIHDRKHDPHAILLKSLHYSADCGWSLATSRNAGTAKKGRRQAEQFGLNLEKPVAEYDFYVRRTLN